MAYSNIREEHHPFSGRAGRTKALLGLLAALILVIAVAAGLPQASRADLGPVATPTATSFSTTTPSLSQIALTTSSVGAESNHTTPCNLTVSMRGTTAWASSPSGGASAAPTSDVGAFLTGLIASHEKICLTPGEYPIATPIQISNTTGVTLKLDPGTVMNATAGKRFIQTVVLVSGSPGTVIQGGQWVGPGKGKSSVIRIQSGSNGTVIEGADISRAGWDGIIVYDVLGTSYDVEVTGNYLHSNGRYGIQEYANASTWTTGTVISDNLAVDNEVGGIYTNGVDGVTIVSNVVANSQGNGPGKIGIGVTNGSNETVIANHVDHMAWFGIQAYYANYTNISDNVSTSNAGGEDQSGITNDHSSHDTIAGNTVENNGDYGVYVERSWDITIRGNEADGNHGYGIGLNHGSIPTMGRASIEGNSCSYNGLGGIILNSAVQNTITDNLCTNNSGDGILLYNDLGEAGSCENVVTGNWLGNEGNVTQVIGVREANQSWNNTIYANETPEDSAASVSLVGG